jgi:hypothetical protein
MTPRPRHSFLPRTPLGWVFAIIVAVALFGILGHLGLSKSLSDAGHYPAAPAVNTSSISYKDGYVTGKQDEQEIGGGVYGTSNCTEAGTLPSYGGGPPSGDNVSQWVTGCISGWNAANYDANHPGA